MPSEDAVFDREDFFVTDSAGIVAHPSPGDCLDSILTGDRSCIAAYNRRTPVSATCVMEMQTQCSLNSAVNVTLKETPIPNALMNSVVQSFNNTKLSRNDWCTITGRVWFSCTLVDMYLSLLARKIPGVLVYAAGWFGSKLLFSQNPEKTKFHMPVYGTNNLW